MKEKDLNTIHTEEDSITGVFGDIWDAEKAYEKVLKRGYSRDDVDILVHNTMHDMPYKESSESDTTLPQDSSGNYLSLSAALGALLGIIAGLGFAVCIVIIGFFIGQLAGAITAASISVIIGTLLGISTSAKKGIPESSENKNIVLRVTPHNTDDARYFRKNWKTHKGKVMVMSGY